MRLVPALLVVSVLSFASAAQAAVAKQAGMEKGGMKERARARLAVAAVKRSLAGWVKPGTKVSVKPAIVPFNGDVRNPITGLGPVEVYVTQERAERGFFGRLFARFRPSAKQKYLVHVGDAGETHLLERISLAPQYRLGRFLAMKVPLLSLFKDLYRSDRAGDSAWMALGATGSAFVNPVLTGAMIMRLGQVVREGIRSQNEFRRLALADTVAWVGASKLELGGWPTLMQTYRSYQAKLSERQEGTRPLAIGEFVHALSMRQL